MQVFVGGVWRDEKALAYRAEARTIGTLIARNGLDLACGPGTGIAKYVMEGYRSADAQGKIRFYLPRQEEMDKVGEQICSEPDEIVRTEFDYPMRNIFQIGESDALIVITGGDGTLEEALAALADYRHPVAVLKDSGTAAQALHLLLGLYPEWQDRLLISSDVTLLMTFVLEHLAEIAT